MQFCKFALSCIHTYGLLLAVIVAWWGSLVWAWGPLNIMHVAGMCDQARMIGGQAHTGFGYMGDYQLCFFAVVGPSVGVWGLLNI
jgi:hypothetical protein